MKKLIITLSLILSLFVASTAMASPLTNYKPGSFAVGLDMQYSKLKGDASNGSTSFDRNWNFSYDAEVGIAPKFALQINGMNPKSDSTGGNHAKLKLQNFEIKGKYKLFDNFNTFVSAYAGLAKNKLKYNEANYSFSSSSKTSPVIGLTGVVKLKPTDLKLYVDVGIGTKTTSWDIGVSYSILRNVELDFGYKWYEARDLKTPIGKIDTTNKGLYIGATVKFN